MSDRQLNHAERLCIQTKSTVPMHDKAWMLEIQEAILNGYRICENDTLLDSCMRNYNGFVGQCVLYPEGREFADQLDSEETTEGSTDLPDEPEKTDSESSEEEDEAEAYKQLQEDAEKLLEGEESFIKLTPKVDFTRFGELTKKADILGYLESLGIEVPENLKQPNAIKKWVKDNYQ